MLALIPARGGSKGLPGKNIRPLNGVPLIGHSIRVAKAARGVTRIVVSTDDERIAQIAREEGAEIPFMRPPELATDTSPAMDTLLYTVDRLRREEGGGHDAFVVLQPTVPLRLPEDVDAAVRIFREREADSVIGVVPAPVPLHWYLEVGPQGVLRPHAPGNAVMNRQDYAELYVPNGAVYVFRTEVLRTRRDYYTERTYPYVMPRERSVDIDELFDFELAEFLLSRREAR